jgi:hypothetical protein
MGMSGRGADDMGGVGRTLEHDPSGAPSKGGRSRRNPGAKQFREPAEEGGDLKNVQKNNFL